MSRLGPGWLRFALLAFCSTGILHAQIQNYRYYTNCVTMLDAAGLHGVHNPYGDPGAAFLYLVAANIQDDGENDTWSALTGTADIGLHIFGGERYEVPMNQVRLYGPFDEGVDEDGSRKYEWDDYCSMQYNNFALIRVSGYLWRCIRILAVEGDDQEWIQGPDDVVFDAVVCLDGLGPEAMRIDGTCDIPGKCATLWLAVRECPTPDCGIFWRR
ncbi:MAG: hypothetical protein WB626_04615 [Bacteroidota bacterium]